MVRQLFERFPTVAEGLSFAVSHTTRLPRPGEEEGKDYYFVDREHFEAMVAAEEFLEWAMVHGQHKGTSKGEVERLLNLGRDVLLDIDVQGARSVRAQLDAVPTIFILPPSFSELESRLRGRGADSEEQVQRRLQNALDEVKQCECYEYVILNEDLDRASEALASIFLSRRYRRDRMQPQIDQVFDRFPT